MATTTIITKKTINIPSRLIQKTGGMVILPIKEYERLCVRSIENFQLKGKQAKLLDNLIMDGMAEYKAGKCKTIKSLADLE